MLRPRAAVACVAAATAAPNGCRRVAACRELEVPTRVWVVGAGAVGVTSAYSLARRGVPVTLLDASTGPATACSSVNAGSLRHSSRGLITQPDKWLHFVKSAVTGDKVFHLHPKELISDITFWRFAGAYLAASSWRTWRQRNEEFSGNTAKWFADVIEEIADREAVGELRRGCLIVRMKPLGPQAPFGPECGPCQSLTAAEAVALEPVLADVEGEITGALLLPEDRYAHCGDFVGDLTAVMQQRYGVQVRFDCRVDSLLSEGGRVRSLALADGPALPVAEGEAVLICTGAATPALLEPLGVRAPIFPMKGPGTTQHCRSSSAGYSITADVPVEQAEQIPGRLVIFEPAHTYVTPSSGNRVRFASVAEFGGNYSASDASDIPPEHGDERLQVIRDAAKTCMPRLAGLLQPGSGAKALCGARPQSADDLPLVGRAPRHQNLWLNVGHGQYGWKLSAGCGEIVASQLLGLQPPVEDVACLDPARFDGLQAPWRRWGWGLARRPGPPRPPAAEA